MDKTEIMALLQDVQKGKLTPEEAMLRMKLQPFEDLGYAKVDHHRSMRTGSQEVIFGQNKTPEQIVGIVKAMVDGGASDILVTRLSSDAAAHLQGLVPIEYHPIPKLAVVNRNRDKQRVGSVIIATGGTSDMAVSEEAALTAEVMGSNVTRLYDVGVAGLHRLLAQLDVLMGCRVVVAVAGMEGALASVIGGLVDCPVIAVPTSVGYGASFGGVAALLAMLNSCASGVSVVNIDNGFGAGFLANRINRMEGIA
jgi:pyridinium-3,5-biscarboxylic acid mononucleotide synthase